MTVRILLGDARARLADLPDGSVHCCVTSPPYFGLRDYGTAKWDGGDPACDHLKETRHQQQGSTSARAGRSNVEAQRNENFGVLCGKCGATRTDGQMGLEPTPDEFVEGMVEVFREVRRVLRDDGTLWLNIGDSYAGSWGAQSRKVTPPTMSRGQIANHPKRASNTGSVKGYGCKPKDLIGIPWMLAFALRADGWYLRQDIIWAKPNPMPESVDDRCTKAHEYLFLLTKRPRYFYDAEAIKGQAIHEGRVVKASGAGAKNAQKGKFGGTSVGFTAHDTLVTDRNKRSVWTVATTPLGLDMCTACRHVYQPRAYRALRRERVWDGEIRRPDIIHCQCGRTDSWLSHFATFPPELVRDCILAGTPARCCSSCGAPVERVTTKGEPDEERKRLCGADRDGGYDGSGRAEPSGMVQNASDVKRRILEGMRVKEHSFEPTCSCDAGFVPGTVLDPFGGAGTTGLVADRLGREAVLIELNEDYAELARVRLRTSMTRVASEAPEPVHQIGGLFG